MGGDLVFSQRFWDIIGRTPFIIWGCLFGRGLVSFKECSQVLRERPERVVVEESGLGGQEMGMLVPQPV